ncbi:MAG: hypothetical protein GF404_04175 [candidate division Zixibacteria bacterium]|nr:hypothetical protein [candidate division Zixibacteria bacterium]
MKTRLPIAVCFVFGLFTLFQYFTADPTLESIYKEILDWMQIIFVFTLLVGVVSLAKIHSEKLIKKRTDWPYSILTILGIVVMAFLGFAYGTDWGTPFLWIFMNIQVPMQSTMFALLAFYVASAAYRGFRFRNREASVLLITALIVMMGRIPLGHMISDIIPGTAEWIIDHPSVAAKRGILIGIGLGSITTALRVILGIERSYLGGKGA